MHQSVKHQVVVENRAGAGGRIGTKSVASAKPDGHTLLWGSGVTGDTRDPLLPDVPTAREVGLPDLAITGFYGLLAPAGTPQSVVDALNAAMREALSSAPVMKAFDNLGFTPAYSTPAQMSERISQGRANYERIVKERGIRSE